MAFLPTWLATGLSDLMVDTGTQATSKDTFGAGCKCIQYKQTGAACSGMLYDLPLSADRHPWLAQQQLKTRK